jgi:SAM-dependent methyltransferase
MTFDYVFSSNVLEHVPLLDELESEIARVLTTDGLAIHILPTHTWRLWTTLTYYPALPKIIGGALRHLEREKDDSHAPSSASVPVEKAPSGLRRYLKWLGTLCMSPRHGERGNRATEFFYFRPSWWLDHFRRHNFDIQEHQGLGIYYSGNYLLGLRLGLAARLRLSAVLGSSTVVFVMRYKNTG